MWEISKITKFEGVDLKKIQEDIESIVGKVKFEGAAKYIKQHWLVYKPEKEFDYDGSKIAGLYSTFEDVMFGEGKIWINLKAVSSKKEVIK